MVVVKMPTVITPVDYPKQDQINWLVQYYSLNWNKGPLEENPYVTLNTEQVQELLRSWNTILEDEGVTESAIDSIVEFPRGNGNIKHIRIAFLTILLFNIARTGRHKEIVKYIRSKVYRKITMSRQG